MNETMKAKTARGADFELEVREQKNSPEKEVRELAVRTGERQLLEVYFTECDGSVRECSADLIRVYIRPDGEKVKERIHTY